MVMVGREKMSKSLGNFTNLSDALDRHGPRAFRLLALQTHYRRQLEMGDKELSDAGKAVDRLDALFRRARIAGVSETAVGDTTEFRAAMDDDFDTPAALAVLHEWASDRQLELLARGLAIFGLASLAERDEAPAEISALAAQRAEARGAKRFDESDRLRDELAAAGWEMRDEPGGGYTLVRRA
jgi:cysteinyl-tRNA synthetase